MGKYSVIYMIAISIITGAAQLSAINPKWENYPDPSWIKLDVRETGVRAAKHYAKYIAYKAPNGSPIYILAQDKITDEQLLKAYNILDFYLNSLNNAELINSIANSKAVINMPNGADGQSSIPWYAVPGQPLYQQETPTEGSPWYIENDYSHRDASYEEILHFVHDYGIGIKSRKRAMPELQKKIYNATMNALPERKRDWGKKGLWGLDSEDWLKELSREGSLEQEYLASVFDSYYGQWAAFDGADGGMWGVYVAKSRDEIREKDIQGYQLMKEMFPEYLSYMARIDPQFDGTFVMTFEPTIPYTHKSRYLLNARLLGTKDSNLVGNDQNNILMGNGGRNTLDGKEGFDVVQLDYNSSDYLFEVEESGVRVVDRNSIKNSDFLINIELLRFKDMDVLIE